MVLYEDAAKRQLQEFISVLRGCELMAQACSALGVILENVESKQLHHLLTSGIIGFDKLLQNSCSRSYSSILYVILFPKFCLTLFTNEIFWHFS